MIRRLKRGLFNSAFRLGTVAARKNVRAIRQSMLGKPWQISATKFSRQYHDRFDMADFRLPAFVYLLKYS
jgi:hypothetical protein